jgi:Tfp pilus assembly protein PilF
MFSCSRLFFVVLLGILLSKPMHLLAQKKSSIQKVDQVLDNDARRKVERAKKLFNKYKVYEGEKVLKELIAQHPEDPYYHEALVQLQQQVLSRIRSAEDFLETIQPSHLLSDSTDADSTGSKVGNKDAVKLKSDEEVFQWNGLDRSESKPKKDSTMSKKEKRKEERIARNASDEAPLTEAVMTIDPLLTSSDTEEDEGEITDEELFSNKPRDSKSRKKQLKYLTDLAQIPYEPYRQELIKNARNATRLSESSDSASHYLRMMLVDTLLADANASMEAKEAYENGLDELNGNSIVEAAKLFEKAISLYPLYYEAHLKLGDTYYLMNKDTAAMKKYRQASLLQPMRPEGFAKLAMVQYNSGRYLDAAALILEAMMIYPEQQYMTLLKRILAKSGKTLQTQWLVREVYPLTTKQTYEEIIAKEKTPWWHYQSSKGDVYGYFDTLGLVRPNEKTNERYLEVYGWKYMLNRSGLSNFPFVRVMDELGYLDCYVLVTLFHQDLYGQFADLVKNQPEKVKNYFYLIMNWDDKKFDKLREKVAKLKKHTQK